MASLAIGSAVALLGASLFGALFTFLGRRSDDAADELYAIADAENPFASGRRPRLRLVVGRKSAA